MKEILKIAIGADHAGFKKKKISLQLLKKLNYSFIDFGTVSEERTDYPDYASKVAKAIIEKKCDAGILFCGTGIGMSIAANKFPGIRAAVCWNKKIAKLAKEHNNANILCVPARFLKTKEVIEIIKSWLTATFLNERHQRRLEKIEEIEKNV